MSALADPYALVTPWTDAAVPPAVPSVVPDRLRALGVGGGPPFGAPGAAGTRLAVPWENSSLPARATALPAVAFLPALVAPTMPAPRPAADAAVAPLF
jgi:hypothetical protein